MSGRDFVHVRSQYCLVRDVDDGPTLRLAVEECNACRQQCAARCRIRVSRGVGPSVVSDHRDVERWCGGLVAHHSVHPSTFLDVLAIAIWKVARTTVVPPPPDERR